MLTVKAKHATMLLTVSEVEGLSDSVDELSDEELPPATAAAGAGGKQLPAHPSVVMVSGQADRTHAQSGGDAREGPPRVLEGFFSPFCTYLSLKL